mmetsp:Transcript_5599/g.16458  ORF Transcript_5599/g.16458 Transcript_5599/m.16458 type:complete len:212 (-) Transcript_5599:3158-3793(-)
MARQTLVWSPRRRGRMVPQTLVLWRRRRRKPVREGSQTPRLARSQTQVPERSRRPEQASRQRIQRRKGREPAPRRRRWWQRGRRKGCRRKPKLVPPVLQTDWKLRCWPETRWGMPTKLQTQRESRAGPWDFRRGRPAPVRQTGMRSSWRPSHRRPGRRKRGLQTRKRQGWAARGWQQARSRWRREAQQQEAQPPAQAQGAPQTAAAEPRSV